MPDEDDKRPICRWCKSTDCTPKTSPHCYCLDCESPLSPCRCLPDCTGGNCYQPSCCGDMTDDDNDKPSEPRVMYTSNGDGQWRKVVYAVQCPADEFLFGKCQGAIGHKGQHWNYKPDGSYSWHQNDDDPSSWIKNAAGGWTPPGHKEYVHPQDKSEECYRSKTEISEITDKDKILALENGELEDGESAVIDKPLTEEEIEWLRESGRLDDIIGDIMNKPGDSDAE